MERRRTSATFAVTLDTDWAPDWVIDEVARMLINNNVKATWFVTHQSPAIDRLRERLDLFELGIHPNCLPGSTQGKTEDEVLAHVKKIVPGAISMRTHGLYQTTRFLMKAAESYGIRLDVSLLLPGADHLMPHRLCFSDGVSIWRVPYFWEDDFEMFKPSPCWNLSDGWINSNGLKIFAFHPIHVVINTVSHHSYKKLKTTFSPNQWTPELLSKMTWQGLGPQTLFTQLLEYLTEGGTWIKELVSLDS